MQDRLSKSNTSLHSWSSFLFPLLIISLSLTTSAFAQTSSTILGSVPSGQATNEVVKLTLHDAINMALRYNLGQIESSENVRDARGQRLRALSLLLPQVSVGVAENVEQLNTATLGIKSAT